MDFVKKNIVRKCTDFHYPFENKIVISPHHFVTQEYRRVICGTEYPF